MKRRLEIARGLLHTPKILFLDEPTLGLDPQSRNQLWTHVKHLNETEGVTVFLTTHYMDEAERVAAPHRHHRPRQDRGAGHAAELKQQTGTDSLEAGVPGADGHDDPRRTRRRRRPDAPDREDVEASDVAAIYILWLRELKRYSRSRAQIIASLGQPLLYLLVLGFGHVMRGQKHRQVFRVVQMFDVRPELVAALRVEAERGLVQKENLRRVQQSAGDFEPPLHAAGKRLHVQEARRSHSSNSVSSRWIRSCRVAARYVIEHPVEVQVLPRRELPIEVGS